MPRTIEIVQRRGHRSGRGYEPDLPHAFDPVGRARLRLLDEDGVDPGNVLGADDPEAAQINQYACFK